MTKDKIQGLVKGIAIGDQLGMPVETYDAVKIRDRHGRISGYIDPDPDHKWFKGLNARTTDDWQQSVLVSRSIMDRGCLNPEDIARLHLEAYKRDETFGWGSTNRTAMENMLNGAPWHEAGVKGSGGNG